MSLNPLGSKSYGKLGSKLRASFGEDSTRMTSDDLKEPDEIRRGNPTLVIYNSIQGGNSSKPENTEQKQGGDDFMVRQHDDPEDLGRQAADARLSQEEMYENLSNVGTAVFDTLVNSYDMALDDAYSAVREAEHKVGDALENGEEDYDTVAEFAEGLEEKIEDELDSLDLDRFTERAYDRFDTEMGTMERNRARFRNENSEFY